MKQDACIYVRSVDSNEEDQELLRVPHWMDEGFISSQRKSQGRRKGPKYESGIVAEFGSN